MRLLPDDIKDRLGEFHNRIVEACNEADLLPMEVSFVLHRIAVTIECYCDGEARAKKKEK